MEVGELCTRDVVTMTKDGSVYDAAQLMREYHAGCIVIVEPKSGAGLAGNIPIGIVTDRDLVIEIIAQQVDIESVTVADVMSVDLLLAKESHDLWETLQRMRSHGVRRIPIVNDKQYLLGILSMSDAIEFLAEELGILSGFASSEVAHEKRRLHRLG